MKWAVVGVALCLGIALFPVAAANPEGETDDAPCWMVHPITKWPEEGCWEELAVDMRDFQTCTTNESGLLVWPPNPDAWGVYDCTTTFIS